MVLRSKIYSLLRFLNYIILVSLLILSTHNITFNKYIGLVLVLLFIANSQLRQYMFGLKSRKGKSLFFISIMFECIFVYLLHDIFNIILFALLYMVVLDVGLFYHKKISIPSITLMSIGLFMKDVLFNSRGDLNILLFNGIGICTFALLAIYLREEESRKKEAQNLYDLLRVSEENLAKAYKELEMYSNTIEEITLLRERTRVSRELHDSVGHALSTLSIQLKAIKVLVLKDPVKSQQMLDMNITYVEEALQGVRRTVRQLKPLEFEAYEGIFTIEEMTKNFQQLTGVQVRLILSKEKWSITSDQSHHLYRIIQESLSNAVRHGMAQHINISIQFKKEQLYVYIKDDGSGCKTFVPAFGIKSIKERVKSMNGFIDIQTSEGEGFELTITLPKHKQTTKEDVL